MIQDLIWSVYYKWKLEQVLENINPPDNVEGLEVNKVNIDVRRKLSHSTKSNDLRYQNCKILYLKAKM